MGDKPGMPLPGRTMTASPPPPMPAEESGETYEITPDELAQLNESGTVTCSDGKVITVSGGEEASPASDASQSGLTA